MVWAVSLSTIELIPYSLSPVAVVTGIRSLTGFGNLVGPLLQSVLYRRDAPTRLYLNRFRGEPAISRFAWPFTPTHSSSAKFSILVGSGLHDLLGPLYPGHG